MSGWLVRRTAAAALLVLPVLTTSQLARANVNASSLDLDVYGFAVSATGDCANPVVVFSNDQATYLDLASSPTLGSGHLDDGTYPCVMIEVSPLVTYAPSVSEGSCTADTTYGSSMCGTGLLDEADAGISSALDSGLSRPIQLLDGSSADCASSAHVVLYLSQWSAGGTTTAKAYNPFEPPAQNGDGDHGIMMGGSLVVAGGSVVGTFVVEVEQSVASDGASCSWVPPKFIFASAPADEDASAGPAGK